MPRSSGAVRAGVLALQGGVAEHARMLESLGAHVTLVRREQDLTGPDGPRVDALVLPGGESSTQGRLLRLLDLADPLRDTIRGGTPTLGTCAGLILLSREIEDPAPGQQTLGILDVTVRRNALGSQVASTEAEFIAQAADVTGDSPNGRIRGALIRAPRISTVGCSARVLTLFDGHVLGATSLRSGTDAHSALPTDPPPLGLVTGIAFHPELCGEPAFHRALLRQSRR